MASASGGLSSSAACCPGYGTVAVDLAAEAKKLKEAAANAKPGDPLYVHQPGQNVPPPVA